MTNYGLFNFDNEDYEFYYFDGEDFRSSDEDINDGYDRDEFFLIEDKTPTYYY